jgi:hypothetical protein
MVLHLCFPVQYAGLSFEHLWTEEDYPARPLEELHGQVLDIVQKVCHLFLPCCCLLLSMHASCVVVSGPCVPCQLIALQVQRSCALAPHLAQRRVVMHSATIVCTLNCRGMCRKAVQTTFSW